jgi:hypothetical protein
VDVKRVHLTLEKHIKTHFANQSRERIRGYNGIELCRSGSTSVRGHQSFSPFARHGQTTESFISANEASKLDFGNKSAVKLSCLFPTGCEQVRTKLDSETIKLTDI